MKASHLEPSKCPKEHVYCVNLQKLPTLQVKCRARPNHAKTRHIFSFRGFSESSSKFISTYNDNVPPKPQNVD